MKRAKSFKPAALLRGRIVPTTKETIEAEAGKAAAVEEFRAWLPQIAACMARIMREETNALRERIEISTRFKRGKRGKI